MTHVIGVLPQDALLHAPAAIMWNGTTRNFLACIHALCLATTLASSVIARASGLFRSNKSRIAMKWLLPLPKLP